MLEFPYYPSGAVYTRGEPANERVIFDLCGEFAAAMTHRITGDNRLLPCWEVDMNSSTIKSKYPRNGLVKAGRVAVCPLRTSAVLKHVGRF